MKKPNLPPQDARGPQLGRSILSGTGSNSIMKITLVTSFLLFMLLESDGAEPSTNTAPVVAQVLSKKITAADIGLKYDGNKTIIPSEIPSTCLAKDPSAKLYDQIRREIGKDYVEKNHLKATDEEIREFRTFQKRFETEDRIKRQKTLVELEKQLKDPNLGASERKQAEEYRATLLSLAKSETQQDAEGRLTDKELRSLDAAWVEALKFNKSVYEKYGGTVAITAFGPQPVGAIKSLLEEYEKDGRLRIVDEDLRSAFWDKLAKPPKFTAKPKDIDFTPYWKKTTRGKDN